MAQLWGGRFTKETDQLVYNFNASITFDKRFYKQDIRGSLAHVAMLAKQGILTEEEKEKALLLQTLEKTGGNRSKAARLLNVSRTTLYEKLRKYHIID